MEVPRVEPRDKSGHGNPKAEVGGKSRDQRMPPEPEWFKPSPKYRSRENWFAAEQVLRVKSNE